MTQSPISLSRRGYSQQSRKHGYETISSTNTDQQGAKPWCKAKGLPVCPQQEDIHYLKCIFLYIYIYHGSKNSFTFKNHFTQ